jgi:trigger factor
MQVTETLSDGLKREYKVVIQADEITTKFKDKLVKLGQSARLPGFRPGKVPESLLRKRFGDALAREVVEEAVSETARNTINEKGLRPAMQPNLLEVGKFEEGKDLEYRFAVETLPDIEPMDFRALALERLKVTIDDGEVDGALKRLAEGNPDIKDGEPGRKAAAGDVTVIDFEGRLDGRIFPGGSATGYHLRLGSGALVPGFEAQLLGAVAGEKREVKVQFPADYRASELAGKDVVFAVTVNEVKAAAPAEINDAFAERIGAKNLAELRTQVRNRIEGDYGAIARLRLKRQLLDKLADGHKFAVPNGMVEAEFGGIWKQVEEQKKAGTLEESDKDKNEDELKTEYRQIAERRVRLGLLLAEVGKRNKIEVAREEVGQAIVREAQRFPGQEKKVIDFYQQNPEALAQLRAPIYEDKVVDFILELAKVADKPVLPRELLATEEAAGAVSAPEKT